MTPAWRAWIRIFLVAGVHAAGCMLAVSAMTRPTHGAEAATVEAIRAAWDKRRDFITSFQYESALEKAVVVSALPFDQNPFDLPPQPGEPSAGLVLRKTLSFAFSRGKLAYHETGDYWNGQEKAIKVGVFKAAFDGVQNRSINDGGPTALGEMETSKKPSDFLLVHSNEFALWMAHSPAEFLERYRGGVATMKVESQHSKCDGRDCVELAIRQPAWVTTIYVDPARAFLPMHVAERHEGTLVHDISIEYQPHEKTDWAVSGWTSKQFTKTGGVTNSITSGRVAKRAINGPVADETFDLAFPAGAHILERNGPKRNYFIQMANGSRRPISEAEYGSLPAQP